MRNVTTPNYTGLEHRSDIDGLRAIAVLAVVAFHASKRIPGGFTGVDIFFVISGFLITSIILNGLIQEKFSFIDFYVRRIRRIFPALILVLLTCWILGWFILEPQAYAQLGKHMIAGAGFVSNVLLWSESGYFDPIAESKPLLHLWSLGIEEQFYLVYPAFLVLAYRGKRKIYVWIVGLLFTSFIINILRIHSYPVATFYLPFSRFWELLLGALLAYINFNHSKLLQLSQDLKLIRFYCVELSLGDIASLAGLLLILIGIFFVSEANSFPGWWALLPTIGGGLLIAAGPKSAINRIFLSNRWMISIGLISYPLYLWHWPLLTLGRMTSIGMDHRQITTILIILASIALSYLTCYFYEKPLRYGFKKHGRVIAFVLTGTITMVAILGAVTNFKGGWSGRFPESVRPFLDYSYDYKESFRNHRCLLSGAEQEFAMECSGAKTGEPLMLIWGDSHGAMLYSALSEASEIRGISVAQFTSSSCPPILNFEKKDRPLCQFINSNIFERITVLHPVTVVLAHDWPQSLPENSLEGLAETVKKLRQVGVQRIILVGPAPHWGKPLQAKLVKYMLDNESSVVPSRMFDDPAAAIQILDAKLRLLTNSLFIEFISTYDSFCNLEGCLTTIVSGQSNDLTAFDDAHLTSAAARYLISKNRDIFFGKAK